MDLKLVREFTDQVEASYNAETIIGDKVSSPQATSSGESIEATGTWHELPTKIFESDKPVASGGLLSSVGKKLTQFEKVVLLQNLFSRDTESEVQNSDLDSFEIKVWHSVRSNVSKPTHGFLPRNDGLRGDLIDERGS